MLIVSQDKYTIINMNNVAVFTVGGKHDIVAILANEHIKIAEYSTEEKAAKALGIIYNFYGECEYENTLGICTGRTLEMPVDEEVKVQYE